MAGRTLLSSGNVGHRLHLRVLRNIGATVTGRTSLRLDIGQSVIHGSRRPGNKTIFVTTIALIGDRNVRSRLGQGIGKQVVSTMTPGTLGRRIDVVHPGWLERCEIGMTRVALTGSRNMIGRLAQGLATSERLAMTGIAGPGG